MLKVFRYYRRHGSIATLKRAFFRSRFLATRTALKALGRPYVRSKYGVLLRANWEDATFEMCIRGAYGTFLADHLANIDYPFIFIDVGANQGLYSLLAAKNAHCHCVLAFEPVAQTYELLADNVRINGLSERVRPIQAGLSSDEGTAVIHTRLGHSGTATLREGFSPELHQSETITLSNSASLDRLLPSEGRIIIKVDVEGHEETVIRELTRGQFFSRVAEIYYEMNEDWCDAEDIARLLRESGLKRAQRVGSGRQYDVLASRP